MMEKSERTQKEMVLWIITAYGPVRTENIERYALEKHITGGSALRYCRWLKNEGKIIGYYENGRQSMTWKLSLKGKQRRLF